MIKKTIKSFVVRTGKLTNGQKKALEDFSLRYCLDFADSEIDFSNIFIKDQPVIIDIGFGMGHALAAQAKDNPNFNFLGIDVYPAGVGSLVSQLNNYDVDNVKIIQHDAVEVLSKMIKISSVDKIQLLYPDPWPKKRHHKRRIISRDFINMAASILKENGIVQIVTDWENYAEYINGIVTGCDNFSFCNQGNSLCWPDFMITSYAKKAIEKKHTINNIIIKKINN